MPVKRAKGQRLERVRVGHTSLAQYSKVLLACTFKRAHCPPSLVSGTPNSIDVDDKYRPCDDTMIKIETEGLFLYTSTKRGRRVQRQSHGHGTMT
jgi:hypothetical protein